MQTKVLNYQIIVEPDVETGTGRPGFYAYSPTLGVADDGDTIEEAITNVTAAIKLYVESLVEDGEPVPVDNDQNIITTTQVNISGNFSVV